MDLAQQNFLNINKLKTMDIYLDSNKEDFEQRNSEILLSLIMVSIVK
jgi:hypothetical protein